MADNEKQGTDVGDAIPMQKTAPTTLIAAGVGVVAVVGVLLLTLGGGDDETEKQAEQIKARAAADEKDPGMTAKEHQEHMKMTARAFQLAEDKAKEKQAAQAQAKSAAGSQQAAKAVAAAPKSESGPAAAAPPPPKPRVNEKAKKKQMDSLDSIGSDITSALE
jgi:hypothetical protein